MISLRDRVQGFFLGVCVGDAIGAPVESLSARDIANLYGKIDNLVSFDHNRYLKGSPIGTVTDDTQLTVAVAEAIIESGEIDMAAIARAHIRAYQDGPIGWGNSTKDAVLRLIQGMSPSESGLTTVQNRGTGNGIAMKAGPIGVYAALRSRSVTENMEEFSLMTHHTNMAVSSGAAWAEAIRFILVEQFNILNFTNSVYEAAVWGDKHGIVKTVDNLLDRLQYLYTWEKYNEPSVISRACNGGGPYVYDSLPFVLLFFLRDSRTFDCVLDTINTGGDTDTTGSMVASAIGALNGPSVFPKHIVSQIPIASKMIDLANRFYDTFQ